MIQENPACRPEGDIHEISPSSMSMNILRPTAFQSRSAILRTCSEGSRKVQMPDPMEPVLCSANTVICRFFSEKRGDFDAFAVRMLGEQQQ